MGHRTWSCSAPRAVAQPTIPPRPSPASRPAARAAVASISPSTARWPSATLAMFLRPARSRAWPVLLRLYPNKAASAGTEASPTLQRGIPGAKCHQQSPRSRFGLAWGAIAGSNGRVAHGPSCGTPRLRFARRHAPHTAPGKRASRNITDWTLRPGVSKTHPNPQHCPTVRCIRAKVELSNKVEGTPNKNPRQRGGRRLNASNCTRRRSSNAQERT